MTAGEILNHELLTLPIHWKGKYPSYLEAVESIGNEYISLLENLSDPHLEADSLARKEQGHLIELARNVLQAVLECLQVYLEEGTPGKAYEIFNGAFGVDGKYAGRTAPVRSLEYDNLFPESFRLRTSDIPLEKWEDLFHVPFEKRHLTNSKRYSIPGYPTLYLSNSVYVAYMELDQPKFEQVYASRFEASNSADGQTQTLLDLRNHPKFRNDAYSIVRFFGRWPVTMACSFAVAYPHSHFKPEYILPQTILEWTRRRIKVGNDRRRVIGVNYSSSKIPVHKKGYYGYFYNTAIPVERVCDSGYCNKLRSLFKLTAPVPFQGALNREVEAQQQGQVKSILDLWHNEIEYVKTGFGKIETVLRQSPHFDLL